MHYCFVFPTQDPSTIEHETAVSGDTYAVVDKPKRSSKKKGGPDVIPPASKGVSGWGFVYCTPQKIVSAYVYMYLNMYVPAKKAFKCVF